MKKLFIYVLKRLMSDFVHKKLFYIINRKLKNNLIYQSI